MKPRPLHKELDKAIDLRDRSIKEGWCGRKDFKEIRDAMDRSRAFLNRFRFASDARVCEHVKNNLDDLGRILLSNSKGPLMKVYMGYLKERNEQLNRAA